MNIEKEIEKLLGEMTLDEKISLVHGAEIFRTDGVERLGIPPLVCSDGPMGVRREFKGYSWDPVDWSNDSVSYLPSNMALAATWNRNVANECGHVLGREARGRGKDVILAPGVNIIRTPLGGRNFEYFSEDPYLTSEMALPMIEGIQQEDVAACIKHFVANNHEENRLEVDIDMDERSLREIYLPAFKKAVQKGGVLTIMAAYNRFRGEFCSENHKLLHSLLRDEWGFDGVVISDWSAVHNTGKAADYGVDIEMSVSTDFDNYYLAEPYKKAIESGELKVDSLDRKVRNILRLMFRLKMFSSDRKPGTFNRISHWQTLLRGARESIVLLKNDVGILPLERSKIKKLLVIGENADRIHSNGGGSAEIKSLFEFSPLAGLTMIGGGNIKIEYRKGYSSDAGLTEERVLSLQKEAFAAVSDADAVILFCGLNHDYDKEEADRLDFGLPYKQDQLIEELLVVRKDAVIVNLSGSPVRMDWIDKADTLVQMFYSGMFSGQVIAEVLFGEINPSGKLPISFPKALEDVPAHEGGTRPEGDALYYNEGLMVGYRHFDTRGIEPLFSFGHGLSYTNFKYGDLMIDQNQLNPCKISLSMNITNIGSQRGSQVIQFYLEKKDSKIPREKQSLKAFEKIELGPGSSGYICLDLDKDSFSHYDESLKEWVVEPGVWLIHAGISSREMINTQEIVIKT